jgi:hypothetical protein
VHAGPALGWVWKIPVFCAGCCRCCLRSAA